jgi:hypothetical protein
LFKHEARLASYKKDIHQLWNQIFGNTDAMNTKLIVGKKNSATLTKTLAHRRPGYKSTSRIINANHDH